MDITWPFWVSGLCGLLFSLIIIALIFNSQFRQDMAASEGKANLFNVISIEGAFILVLCGLLFTGLIYPVAFPQNQFKHTLEAHSLSPLSEKAFVKKFIKMKHDFDQLTAQVDSEYISLESLIDFIKDLSPESELAKNLFPMPAKKMGPWSPFPNSKKIRVSIPSYKIKAGHALSCQEFYGERFQLIGQPGQSTSPVTVVTDGYIFKTADCHRLVSYDLQISCEDAKILFGERTLTCDKNGEAKWFNKPKDLSVYLTPSHDHSIISKM
ncbi:hypothetical protein NBRC116188_10920 [Oceaniserpentilla sp. 4NH20-0058]|uniref:hypothetical protein n=1 Tax=Oceaniserpentilla sp. 4NH20-0058 TaxID=3127660 RepID=UPI00310A35DF